MYRNPTLLYTQCTMYLFLYTQFLIKFIAYTQLFHAYN